MSIASCSTGSYVALGCNCANHSRASVSGMLCRVFFQRFSPGLWTRESRKECTICISTTSAGKPSTTTDSVRAVADRAHVTTHAREYVVGVVAEAVGLVCRAGFAYGGVGERHGGWWYWRYRVSRGHECHKKYHRDHLEMCGNVSRPRKRKTPQRLALAGFYGRLWQSSEVLLVEPAGIEPASANPPHRVLHT